MIICFGCSPLVAKRTCIKGGFHYVHALFYIVVHCVHVRCLIKCLLGIFSLVWTLMSTKLWGFLFFYIRNMFDLLVVYLTHLASYVHFPCFGHTLHIATSCTHICYPCHALVYTLFLHRSIPCFFILECHVYLILCSILFYLRFELYFLIHLAFLMHHYHYSYLHLLPSFILNPLSICDKKGESML